MADQKAIKKEIARSIKTISARPSAGMATETMKIVSDENGLCTITEDEQNLTIDIGKAYGGNSSTPSPGFFAKAALGACLAQGYRIWAAYLDVPLDDVKIELQTSYDMRGNLRIDESIPASYTEVRYIVELRSSAKRKEIDKLIEQVEKTDAVLEVFREGVNLVQEIKIVNS